MEGVCLKNGMSIDETTQYIGKSKEYAKRSLIVSEQLGIAQIIDSKYHATNEASVITRANKEQWPVIFRKFLQRYNPFILFVSLVGKGNSIQDAARKIKVIYNIDANADIVARSLVSWGEYSGLLKKEKMKITLLIETENLSAEYIQELLAAMEHDVKARVYIANKLGEEVFGYMKQDELDYLVKAIREHQSDPRGSIEDAGRAFEDFLRRLAIDKSLQVNGCKGIQEIADVIRGQKLIDTKQLDLCKASNALRVAAAHSLDRNSVEKWILNPDAAIECILIILTAIRSIHNYIFKQVQMF